MFYVYDVNLHDSLTFVIKYLCMEPIKRAYTFRAEDSSGVVRKYIELMNVMLPEDKQLTAREIDVVVYLIISEPSDHPFWGVRRKMLREKLGLTDPALSFHIRRLTGKGFLTVHVSPKANRIVHQLDQEMEFVRKRFQESDGTSMQVTVDLWSPNSGKNAS